MNHKDLVKLAGKWLSTSKGCNPVFMERGSNGCSEIPDAIGWTAQECLVVECKVSRSDLIANFQKQLHMGSQRYFLLPRELFISTRDLCKEINVHQGYGIIVANEENFLGMPQQERFMGSGKFNRDFEGEARYLRSRIFEIQNFGRSI